MDYELTNQTYNYPLFNDYNTKRRIMEHQAKTDYKAMTDVWKNELLTKQKADLTAIRELQQTSIVITPSGEVLLTRDAFKDKICKPLSILITENVLYLPLMQEQEDSKGVLKLTICSNRHQHGMDLWISKDCCSEKNLKTIFLQSEIIFGFGNKKESEIRQLFIVAAFQSAALQKIPMEHGWYKDGDTFKYAYPGDDVWKEAYENARKYF